MFARMTTQNRPTAIDIRSLTSPAARYDKYGMLLRTGRSPGEWFRMDANSGGGDGGGQGNTGTGGSGSGTGEGGNGNTGEGGTGTGGTGNQNTGQGQQQGQQQTGEVDIKTLPEPVQKLISELRNEAANRRTQSNEFKTAAETAAAEKAAKDEQLQAIAKALGLTNGEPTVEELQQQLAQRESTDTEKDNTIRTLKTELAFRDVANEHGADLELTLAVLERNGQLKSLDPSADDFKTQLSQLVKTAVDGNEKLKVTQVAPRGGSRINANTGGGGSAPSKGLAGAIDAALSGG